MALLFLLTTAVAAAGGAGVVLLLQQRGALSSPHPLPPTSPHKKDRGKKHHTPVGSPSKSNMVSDPVEGKEDIFPPLPPTVVALLQSTRVCHLSTASTDGLPHLSLMRFTYRREEEVIIMTTRTDTKKYELLCSMPKVAVLVHDFPSLRDEEDKEEEGEEEEKEEEEKEEEEKEGRSDLGNRTGGESAKFRGNAFCGHGKGEKGGGVGGNEDGGEGGSKRPHRHEKEDGKGGGGKGKEGGDGDGHTYAITLNGVARMETGEEAERYRSLHLKNNVAYSQFIEGPGIAVFTVHVMSARICNVKDRVTYWDKRTATVEEGVRREEKGEGRGKRQEE